MSMRCTYGVAAALLAAAVVCLAIVAGGATGQVEPRSRSRLLPATPPDDLPATSKPAQATSADGKYADANDAQGKAAPQRKPEDYDPVFLGHEAEQRVAKALAKNIDVSLADVPLDVVAKQLGRETGVEIALDVQALKDAGIAADTKITLSLRQVSLKAALRIMLRRIDLTYVVQDGRILITDMSKASVLLKTGLYPVEDLVTRPNVFGELESDYDALIELITSHCAPVTWDAVGGSGSLREFVGILVISQTPEVHDQIIALLRGIRRARERQGAGDYAPLPTDAGGENMARVLKALDENVDLEFTKTPLAEFALVIGEKAGINVLVDERALVDEGIDTELTITGSVADVPLQTALHRLLRDEGLGVMVRDEVLWIITAQPSWTQIAEVIYPCRDFRRRLSETDYQIAVEGLVETIASTVQPSTWDAVGGYGAIRQYDMHDVIVVSQTREAHRQIAALLEQVRDLHRRQHADDGPQEDALETRVYDIQFSAAGGTAVAVDAKEVAQVIRDLVEPQSWNEEGVYLRSLSDRVVVRHRRSVQQKVRRMIDTLHAPDGASQGGGSGGAGFGGGGGGAF